MAVPEIVDSDALYTGGLATSIHFTMQIIFADGENPAVILEAVEHFEVVLHFLAEEFRHLNNPDALRRFGGGNHILLIDALVGFVDAHGASLKIEVRRC